MFVFGTSRYVPLSPFAGLIRKRPPSWLSKRVEHTGSESNRGKQHQTISPLLCTRAENWQFPITPRSSRRIFRTLAQDERAPIRYAPHGSTHSGSAPGSGPLDLGRIRRGAYHGAGMV